MIGKITLDGLYKLGASRNCPGVAKFAAMFPDGAELTEESHDRAVAAGLDVEWLGWRILPAPALTDYRRARGAALADYKRACVAAWTDYRRTRDAAVKAAFAATYWAAKGGTE